MFIKNTFRLRRFWINCFMENPSTRFTDSKSHGNKRVVTLSPWNIAFAPPPKVIVPGTAAEFATESVTVVPTTLTTVAALPIPLPRTDIPAAIPVALATVMVVCPAEPVAVVVAAAAFVRVAVVIPRFSAS